MKNLIILLSLALSLLCQQPKTSAYCLVWSDEFEYPGLPDTSKWNYNIGGHGWGNNELQFYSEHRAENARVENGVLVIEARKESYMAKEYSSARLITKGKAAWRYGRIEVRAKLPRGLGAWPAIWMLPLNSRYGRWPACGEIDIMENVGFDSGKIHGSVHTKRFNHIIGTQKTSHVFVTDTHNAFHTYAIEWGADSILFLVDEKNYFKFENDKSGFESWPFDQEFYLLLNVAVGGNWGGQKGVDDTSLPWKMEIDYVRVFKKSDR